MMSHSHHYILFFSLLSLSLSSCINNIDIDVDQKSYLIVDGLISTSTDPHMVNLSRFNIDDGRQEAVVGAEVTITDDIGNIENLKEVAEGKYSSVENALNGEIGRCYTLELTLSDGSSYISKPEEIFPNVGLDSIYWEEGVTQVVTDLNNIIEYYNISIYAESKTFESSSNFYRWRYKNIYEFMTAPERRTKADPSHPIDRIPDPPPCSGYIVDSNNNLVQISECTCCICYVTEYGENAIVSDDRFSSGAFKKQKIETFLVDDRFTKTFYIEVDLVSLSEHAFNFWSLISKNTEDNTSVFSPQPGQIKGNITSLDNPDELVMGYFGASDISTGSIFIKRQEISNPIPLTDELLPEDCRYRKNSDNVRPDFW